MKIPLELIPEPEPGSREVMHQHGADPIVLHGGEPGHDYVCSSCGVTLLQGIQEHLVQHVVIQCGACGAFNDTATE